ncbi:MAG TPA: hypothetical protein VFC51_06805 [Chloroflexota bacterium]|nr:hypothetical protein [Chloroflexota bacterium]
MPGSVRLYAGTHEGLYVLREGSGGWREEAVHLRGGIVDSIGGSLKRPERVYAGVAHDGVYRTVDAGRTWSKTLDGDVRSIAVDPGNDEVVYAGMEPTQLYRSDDGGRSWREVTSLFDMPEEVRDNWWSPVSGVGHVRSIFVHDEDSNLLCLGLEHGGIIRSFDGGQSWDDVSGGIDYLDIHLVASVPGRFDRYFVSSARGFFTASEPAHGWTRAENGFTRDYFHDFVFLAPESEGQSPTMLIATADKSPGYWQRPEGVYSARAAIFRSDDCAESWRRVAEAQPEPIDAMISTLIAHPVDANSAFAGVGEVSRGHAHGEAGRGWVWITRDRGDTWRDLGVSLPADRVLWAAPA